MMTISHRHRQCHQRLRRRQDCYYGHHRHHHYPENPGKNSVALKITGFSCDPWPSKKGAGEAPRRLAGL